MKTRFIRFSLLTMLTGICFITNAQQKTPSEVHSFTAQEAVAYALKNAVQVKNALVDIQLQEQQNKQITAAALPQVNGTVSFVDYLSIPTQLVPAEFAGGTPGTFFPIKFGTKYSGTYGANLQQILFDGQVFVGLQARKSAIKNSVLTADVTKQQIKANVFKIYYQLAVAKRQIGTLDAHIAN
jgi:outer membrane protein TolC